MDINEVVKKYRLWLFLLFGGGSFLVQLGLLWWFEKMTAPVWANITSIVIASLLNFSLHYFITWRDRVIRTKWKALAFLQYWILFVVAISCGGITIIVKVTLFEWIYEPLATFGRTITYIAEHAGTVGAMGAAIVGEAIAVPANFFTGDKITFGAISNTTRALLRWDRTK